MAMASESGKWLAARGSALPPAVWTRVAGVAVLAGVTAMGSGAVAGQALAGESPLCAQPEDVAGAEGLTLAPAGAYVEEPQVIGEFAFSQDVLTPTDQVFRAMYGVDRTLCSGGEVEALDTSDAPDAAVWRITVDGSGVSSAFTATMDDLSRAGVRTLIMGCTCLGNPADGRASVNVQVSGVSVASVLEMAGVSPDANVITFVSSDGYEVSLPLTYVLQRSSMLVSMVNGEPIANSMGGVNQLWLGSTAARYFSRDVVEVRVDVADEVDVPPAPGTSQAGDAYANRPNVGVLSGASA